MLGMWPQRSHAQQNNQKWERDRTTEQIVRTVNRVLAMNRIAFVTGRWIQEFNIHPWHANVVQTEKEHNDCHHPIFFTEVMLRAGQTVTFIDRDGNIPHEARVLGVDKATGKNKNWYYLQHLQPDGSDGQKKSIWVDMSHIDSHT